jgi:hypothetical protein
MSFGKIILAVSVFICRQWMDGGLPPNCWENKQLAIKKNQREEQSFLIIRLIIE